jgi:hypothetical protein
MDLLEVEARMGQILPEQPIRLPGLPLDVGGQGREQLAEAPGGMRVQSRSRSSSSVSPARCSARASAASRASL